MRSRLLSFGADEKHIDVLGLPIPVGQEGACEAEVLTYVTDQKGVQQQHTLTVRAEGKYGQQNTWTHGCLSVLSCGCNFFVTRRPPVSDPEREKRNAQECPGAVPYRVFGMSNEEVYANIMERIRRAGSASSGETENAGAAVSGEGDEESLSEDADPSAVKVIINYISSLFAATGKAFRLDALPFIPRRTLVLPKGTTLESDDDYDGRKTLDKVITKVLNDGEDGMVVLK